MFLASTALLPPASTRILDWPIWGLESNHGLALLCAAAAPVVALASHDVKTDHSVHPVTLVGGAAMVAMFALCGLVVPRTESGARVVSLLYELMR